MTRSFFAVLLLLLCSPLSAEVRVDLGIAAGEQEYETRGFGSRFMVSPEVQLSRGPLALYYSIDYAELPSAGKMYSSHLGVGYRWPIGRRVSVQAGAGPSYVSVENLGGEPTWHAQVELALRTGRFEWFAKLRQYDYSLSEFRIANASPDGPALLGGFRFRLR